MAAISRFTGPDYYELALEERVKRGTATVNIRWEDKSVFDAIQVWLSYRKGEPVSHWEAFTFILATALASENGELRKAQLFVRD